MILLFSRLIHFCIRVWEDKRAEQQTYTEQWKAVWAYEEPSRSKVVHLNLRIVRSDVRKVA